MTTDRWEYRCGELCLRSATRVYRRDDGRVGKIIRTRGDMTGMTGRSRHTTETRYFVWGAGDGSPEYATEADAEQAARGVVG